MFKFASAAVVLACVGSASASISVYTGHNGGFVPVDTAIFDDTFLGGGNTGFGPFDTHGLNFRSVNTNANFWGYAFPGGDGSASCYFNGGAQDVLGVKKSNNSDFNTVEMQVGNGQGADPQYVWIQALKNGVQVGSFDVDLSPQGAILGMTGGGFDEFRIQTYNNPGDRNLHVETTFGAGAVDNVGWNAVPTPGAAALLGLGGLMAGRRRR